MITLEITCLENPDQNGVRTFYQDVISIGGEYDDIFLYSKKEDNYTLSLTCEASGVRVQYCGKPEDIVYVENKRSHTTCYLKKGQCFRFAHNSIKVIDFQFSPSPSDDSLVKEKLGELIGREDPLLGTIKEWEEKLKEESAAS